MKNSSTSYIVGLILIVFGGVWLTSNIGMFDFDVWEYFWPTFFIAIGVVLAVKGRALFIATLFIFFGALNLAANIFYISFDYLFNNFWPIILIALGLLILFRKRDRNRRDNCCGEINGSGRRWRHHRRDDRAFGNPFYYNGTEQNTNTETKTGTDTNTGSKENSTDSDAAETDTNSGSKSDENKGEHPFNEKEQKTSGSGPDFKFYSDSKSTFYSDSKNTFYSDKDNTYYNAKSGFTFNSGDPVDIDKIDEVAILTSCRKYITSQNFKGGSITAILGGGIIDLSGAKLAEGENVLELTSIMGGMSFRVPQDWKVIVNVHSIFGGFEDKRRYFSPVEPKTDSVLIIKGTVLMGGGTLTF